jgi:hypothetical protein
MARLYVSTISFDYFFIPFHEGGIPQDKSRFPVLVERIPGKIFASDEQDRIVDQERFRVDVRGLRLTEIHSDTLHTLRQGLPLGIRRIG